MTRINCIPVSDLTDKHLMAEYREITRIAAAYEKSIKAGKVDITKKYTMGKGHVKFFYDKVNYLVLRTMMLHDECKKRGFNVEYKVYNYWKHARKDWWNNWHPTIDDETTNWNRILERLYESYMKKRSK